MSLRIENLSFSYDRKHPLIRQLSLEAKKGEISAILGRNGAGKSTLFHLILGFQKAEEGDILLDGEKLETLDPRTRAQRIAWIPQDSSGRFPFTVFEMVLMGVEPQLSLFSQPGAKEEERALRALSLLGLESFSNRSFATLSGGERQLVLIARALAQGSRCMILDEPCASLDLGHRVLVMDALRSLAREGYLLLMSTHDPQLSLSYASRVFLLDGGRISAEGRPEEILSSEALSRLYRIPIEVIEGENGRRAVLTISEEGDRKM